MTAIIDTGIEIQKREIVGYQPLSDRFLLNEIMPDGSHDYNAYYPEDYVSITIGDFIYYGRNQ